MSGKEENNAEITVVHEKAVFSFSNDKMEGHIIFSAPKDGGNELSADEVKKIIEDSELSFGLDEEFIEQISEGPRRYEEQYTIATGAKPIHGENGKIEYFFNAAKKTLAPKVNEDGTVDFRNLDLIEMIDEGKAVAKLVEPTAGTPGTDIFGNSIPPQAGKPPPKLPKGKNTVVSDDGTTLLAERSGQIVQSGSSISISEILEIKQDVDNSTGNVDFNGSVVVNGNILQGFRVAAVGNIEVKGIIEGAEVVCEGNLVAAKGILGMNTSSIKVSGSVSARSIQDADMEVGGDIASTGIMHSDVRCNGRIELSGKGVLVGGTVFCKEAITANILGSPLGTQTDIKTGLEPKLYEKYKELVAEFQAIKKQAEDLAKELAVLGKPENINDLPEFKKKSYIKTLYEAKAVQDKYAAKRAEVLKVRTELEEFKHSGKISALGAVHPGVNLQIGNAVMSVRDELPKCRFTNDEGRVKIAYMF
ncbi:MAG: FapA family protein [Defluviitaleaceae bacterium]|nr:FapA family protein [Defluviitaleaceae bacterium]